MVPVDLGLTSESLRKFLFRSREFTKIELTTDKTLDFLRLHNWLSKFRFEVKGVFDLAFGEGGPKLMFVKDCHASGHASKSDSM